MLKNFTAVLVAAALIGFTAPAHAASEDLVQGMIDKAWIGLVDTFTGWVELPAQVIKGYSNGFMDNQDQKLLGAVVGIFEGFGHAAGRTGSGMINLFGFWAANPMSNEGVGLPLDAEYAWEEGMAYDMFDPDLMEGAVKPVGQKLVRGLGNGLLGIAELPGQIVKGVQEGEPAMGLVKGVWYWFSREVYGLGDIVTVILPNPVENKGMAFEEEWPWDALMVSME
jgi:putative exosortase-associated protein (TIGR04073 family)